MRAVVVVNPRAGRGRPLHLSEAAVEHLRGAGAEVVLRPTERANHATEIAEEERDRADLLVVVGGDGTLRETLVGLGERASSLPVGLVPAGHGNVVARELGIPLDAERAVPLLTAGVPRAIDVGLVDDGETRRLFLAVVGVGFDAIVTRGVDRWRRARLGRWLYGHGLADAIYVVSALPSLARLRPRRFTLREGDTVLAEGAPTVLACSMATYAKGWSMAPDARADSGRLHWVAVRRCAAPFVLAHVWAASRRRRAGFATYGDGRALRIDADRPFTWQADGDPMPRAAFLELEVLPAYARVIAPLTDAPPSPASPAGP